MYNSLKYIQRKFPYFLDMTSDSNVNHLTRLLDDSFIDILNSLERVRDGYYLWNNQFISLDVMDSPVLVNQENTLIFKTNLLLVGDVISFNSSLFGELGEARLSDTGDNDAYFREHICIEALDDEYNVQVRADDIKTVTITNMTTGEETLTNYSYEEHVNVYETSIPSNDEDYMVQVETWNEYTYTSYTDKFNPDLDCISKTLTGATRRNYTSLDDVEDVLVDVIVNTLTGDDNNDGLTMNTAYKSLTKATGSPVNVIGFIGYEKSLNILVLYDTTIIGAGSQSNLDDVQFWVEPGTKLTLKNIILNGRLITEKSVVNIMDKSILIR